MKFSKLCITIILSSFIFISCSPGTIPEMKECMNAHGSLEKYSKVIKKYASPELLPKINVCCTLTDSRIINSEKVGDRIYYWEEGRLLETSYEIPSDTIQIIKVGWENKKIVYIEFLGPLKFHERKYIKSKEAKAKERKITR